MTLSLGPTLAGACMLAGISGSALAHATLQPEEAAANGTVRATLTVPHGCDGQATIAVRVEIPEGFLEAKPMPKPGWTISLETGASGHDHSSSGAPASEEVRAIVWSGGELPDAHFDEFVFRGRVGDLEPGTVLAFGATQTCADGEVAWVELPAAGQSAHDLDHPAPTLTVIASPRDGEDHGSHDGGGNGYTLGDLTIRGLFSRATAGRSGAAYLVVENAGGTADRLVTVASPVAAKVELHEMTIENDIMRMAAVEGGIEVPAHGSAALAPGGLHVMLMGLDGPLEEGAAFPLTLGFEHAGEVTVTVPVLSPAADGVGDEDHSSH